MHFVLNLEVWASLRIGLQIHSLNKSSELKYEAVWFYGRFLSLKPKLP